MKIQYSFDVFDTCLVRIWAKSTDLFLELGYQFQQECLISIPAEAWSKLRIQAERNARKMSATNEVTLLEIYKFVAKTLDWSEEEIEKATQKEIQLELLSLRTVPKIQREVQSLHKSNQRVIYLSDMYLPKEDIKSFLQKNKIWSDIDTLYVSSETKVNKSSGKLFQLCLKQESLQASELNHTGDNLYSDVRVPQKLGVKTQSFTQTQLNRYEQLIYKANNIPLKFRSLVAGASRLTRLQSQEDKQHERVIWDTSASVIAPVLFGFVLWCLQEAESKGIKKLYFVARDGQILLKIAKNICQAWHYDIECRYLYGSRQAWHFPAIQELGETELDWLFDPTYFLSVRSVCERVNLKPEQISDVLNAKGFSEKVWDNNLDTNERNLLKVAFQEQEISDLIISIAAKYREETIGYFQQEGMLDSVPFGIVDIGWNGRLQRSLSNLLNAARMYPKSGVYGFYFGLSRRVKAFPTDKLLAYFCEPNTKWKQQLINKALLEIFVAADHGGTVKFQKNDDRYIPILRSEQNTSAIKWGLLIQQKAVEEFANQLTSNLLQEECKTEYFLKISEILLRKFTYSPSFEEAEAFGSFDISEDQTDNIYYELAPHLDLNDLFNWLLFNKKIHNNVWLYAAIVRSDSLTNFQKILLKYLLHLRSIFAIYLAIWKSHTSKK